MPPPRFEFPQDLALTTHPVAAEPLVIVAELLEVLEATDGDTGQGVRPAQLLQRSTTPNFSIMLRVDGQLVVVFSACDVFAA